MKSAWIVLLPFLGLSCAEYRNFYCHHCAQPTHATEPGEARCQTCFKTNVWAVCPACGAQESLAEPGPFRCKACRAEAVAATCPRCGRMSFAREAGAPCPSCGPRPEPEAVAALKKSARAHAERGDWGPAAEAWEAALRLEPGDGASRYALACALARGGRPERALDELERAIAAGYANGDLLRKDPDLAPLRSHPRWPGLLDKAGD